MKKLIIGNWKMNPSAVKDAVVLAKLCEREAKKSTKVEVVLAPPFPFIVPVARAVKKAKLGAQNFFWEQSGAFTGEVSIDQLKSLGVRYVIVGHSERRAQGETNTVVHKKTKTSLKAGVKTVLCVGEEVHHQHEAFPPMVREEIHEALRGVSKSLLKNLVIAYEPIWAVGTGKPATPQNIFEVTVLIRRELYRLFGKKVALNIPILYGGSVSNKNAALFVAEGRTDGLLVGGASVNQRVFVKIIESVNAL